MNDYLLATMSLAAYKTTADQENRAGYTELASGLTTRT